MKNEFSLWLEDAIQICTGGGRGSRQLAADLFGVSRQTVWNWLQNKTMPDILQLRIICSILQVKQWDNKTKKPTLGDLLDDASAAMERDHVKR